MLPGADRLPRSAPFYYSLTTRPDVPHLALILAIMKYITIEALRRHCNSYPEDDDLLEFYWEVSLAQVQKDVGQSLTKYENENGELPPGLIMGACLLTGHLFRNREATSTVDLKSVVFGYQTFIKPFVHFDPDWRRPTTTTTSEGGETTTS